jgi:hypothetical protein
MNLSPEAMPPFRRLQFRRFLTTSSKVLMTSSFAHVVSNVCEDIYICIISPHTHLKHMQAELGTNIQYICIYL